MRAHAGAVLVLSAALGLLGTGCAGAAGTGAALPKNPEAQLTEQDRAEVATGTIVTRPLEFDSPTGHYVGGIATGLVKATPEHVLAAMDDVEALAAMLPRTKHATFVDGTDSSRRIELCQGNSIVEATYTVRLFATDKPGELRFELDRSRPHGIDDVYGYFQVERFDDARSLVTVASAVDVGSGFMAMLFGKRVQDVILSAPNVMRDYFARVDRLPPGTRMAQNDAR
jgi:hypothetical protein